MINRTKLILIVLAGLVVVVLLAGGSLFSVLAGNSNAPAPLQMEAAASPAPNYGSRRQQIFDHQATVAAQPRPAKPAQTYDPPRVPTVVATARRGITDIQQSPMFQPIALIQNQWFGEEAGKTISVAAGAARNDRTQGFVGVHSGGVGPGARSDAYYTPIKAGPVHITAANGTQLTLITDSGITFVFDYTTGQFLNVSPSNYPTATPGAPLPTPTFAP